MPEPEIAGVTLRQLIEQLENICVEYECEDELVSVVDEDGALYRLVGTDVADGAWLILASHQPSPTAPPTEGEQCPR